MIRSTHARLRADLRKDLFEQQREGLHHKERSQKAEEMVATLKAHVSDLQGTLQSAEADVSSARTAQSRLDLENKELQRNVQRLQQQLVAAKETVAQVCGGDSQAAD
jgi:peptidoglycan hydrolase CwlO-like protein